MDGINAEPYEANQIRPSVWACMRCFNEDMTPTMESECTSSNNLILSSGDSPKIIRSVCEQIVNNINADVPWRYMGIDIQPPDWEMIQKYQPVLKIL